MQLRSTGFECAIEVSEGNEILKQAGYVSKYRILSKVIQTWLVALVVR